MSAEQHDRAPEGRPIVVIEDDRETLAGLAELLRDTGFPVIGVATFEEGREALNHEPRLLIADLRLGAYNGMQLVIRARWERPDLPIIVVTGFADERVRNAADFWGARCLEKPVDPDHLLRAVADALAGKRLEPARRVQCDRRLPTGTHSLGNDKDRRPSRPEQDEMLADAAFAPDLATPGASERGNPLQEVVIEDGDVVIVRESAGADRPGDLHSSSPSPSQFRLSVRGHQRDVRLFANYDQALGHAEALAAEHRVRLFYVDSLILILLKNHRPPRAS